jgi:hypothetical protein
MNPPTRSTPAAKRRSQPLADKVPGPDPRLPGLSRVVFRFWVGALVLAALLWVDAMFDHRGTIGGAGSEPHAYLIPIATLLGGAVALGIASRTRLVVADRRPLYLWWTAPAVVAVLLTGIGRSGLPAEPITNVVLQSGIVVFASFLITLGALARQANHATNHRRVHAGDHTALAVPADADARKRDRATDR